MINYYSYINDKICISDSPKGGSGVYSLEYIPRDELVEQNLYLELNKIIIESLYFVCLANGIGDKNAIKLDKYLYQIDNNILGLAFGYGSLYNHSDVPNCQIDFYPNDKIFQVITLKEIKPGDELTIYYGKTWFETKNIIKK